MDERQDNEIETRLQAMRPAEPSDAVRRRIAESLNENDTHRAGALPWRWPMVAGLAAASALALGVMVWAVLPPGLPTDEHVAGPPAPDVDAARPDAHDPDGPDGPADRAKRVTPGAPQLSELNRALRASPDRLIELIDRRPIIRPRHADAPAEPVYTVAGIYTPDTRKPSP